MIENDSCFDSNKGINFYDLLNLLDVEINRLNWSEARYKAFIETNYYTHSRLLLTDDQLFDLLARLKSLKPRKIRIKKMKIGKR